jgi:hypothetical protein
MSSCHVVDDRTDTGAGHEAEDHGISAANGDESGDEPGEPALGELRLVQLVGGHVLSSLSEIIGGWPCHDQVYLESAESQSVLERGGRLPRAGYPHEIVVETDEGQTDAAGEWLKKAMLVVWLL